MGVSVTQLIQQRVHGARGKEHGAWSSRFPNRVSRRGAELAEGPDAGEGHWAWRIAWFPHPFRDFPIPVNPALRAIYPQMLADDFPNLRICGNLQASADPSSGSSSFRSSPQPRGLGEATDNGPKRMAV